MKWFVLFLSLTVFTGTFACSGDEGQGGVSEQGETNTPTTPGSQDSRPGNPAAGPSAADLRPTDIPGPTSATPPAPSH